MASLKSKAQDILNEKTAKIIPENIKTGVNVFDIVGTNGKNIFTELQNMTNDKSFRIKFKNEESLQQAFNNEKTLMAGLGVSGISNTPNVANLKTNSINTLSSDNPFDIINQLNVFDFCIGRNETETMSQEFEYTMFNCGISNPMLVVGTYACNQLLTELRENIDLAIFPDIIPITLDETTNMYNIYALSIIPYLGAVPNPNEAIQNSIWYVGNVNKFQGIDAINTYLSVILYVDQSFIDMLTEYGFQDKHTQFMDIPSITTPGWYKLELNVFSDSTYNYMKLSKDFELTFPRDRFVFADSLTDYYNSSLSFANVMGTFGLGNCLFVDNDLYDCKPIISPDGSSGTVMAKDINFGPFALQEKFNTFIDTYFDEFNIIDYVEPETYNLYITVNTGVIEEGKYKYGFCDETGSTIYYSFDPSTLEYIENFDDYNKLAKLEMPLSTLKNITKTVFPYYATIDKETDQIIDYNNSSYVAISYFRDNSCIFINIPMPV